jgi:hypothetical protein
MLKRFVVILVNQASVQGANDCVIEADAVCAVVVTPDAAVR